MKGKQEMKQVDINGEKEKMEKILKQQDSDKYVKIFLIKITKKGIDLYKQEADQETKKTLLKSIVESMEQPSFHKRDIKPYDPVITYKNVHEQVEVSEYENIKSVISQFNDEQQHLLSTSCETEKTLHNYLIEIKKDGLINLKFIGSFINAFQLEKKMLFGNFTDSTIKLWEQDNLFGLNKKIDLMIVDDERILINQAESKFDSIFGMNKKFAEQATDILNNNKNIRDIFEPASINFLKSKVKSGKRLATRLIKIVSDTNRFMETVKHIDKIEIIKNNPTHKFYKEIENVTFSNGKLSITDKKNCVQLVNAISDALVTAYISEVETVEEGRM